MANGSWAALLVAGLIVNAILGFVYRVYRLTKGGPLNDVIGQVILAVFLLAAAGGLALGAGWVRWVALAYALLFGLAVMPVWILAVLIPLRPGWADYSFTALYWLALALIGVSAILA